MAVERGISVSSAVTAEKISGRGLALSGKAWRVRSDPENAVIAFTMFKCSPRLSTAEELERRGLPVACLCPGDKQAMPLGSVSLTPRQPLVGRTPDKSGKPVRYAG